MDRFPPTVLESEDSDVEEGPDVVRHKTKIIYQNTFPYIHMEPPDVLYERWAKIKLETRQALGHMLHISVFWWHVLFRQQENHSTTAWAVDMGFLDSNVSNDLSLKRLHRIEILELILNTIERCLADTEAERKARELVLFSTSFKLQEDCLVDAVKWLEEFGPPGFSRKLLDLGPKSTRYHVLQFIFIEYARYVQVVSCSKKKMIRELSVEPEPWSLQKSEEMKNKGNEQFQKKKYDLAVKWYTKAIKYHTNNHLLYGNRALCFLRCEKYLKAVGDGKRAIILKRDWAKGHYRFCDALFFLGDKEKALEANMVAQNFCSADPEGMRDLCQQYSRFMMEPYEVKAEGKPKKTETKKGFSKRHEGACGLDSSVQQVNSQKDAEAAPGSCAEEIKKAEERTEQQEPSGKPRTTEETSQAQKDVKIEMGDRKTKSSSVKQAVRSKHPQVHQVHEKPQPSSSGPGSKEQFCAAVLDAYTALADQRCRNAEQAFSLALSILDSSGTKDLGITELDKSLLLFGYATALVEIGQPEELAEAQRQFAKLSSSEDRKFQCLVHFGIGKVFLKENRFPKALEEFSNALLMVQRQITPGKLTWPTTKVTVEETRPEYLKEQLMSFIELCKFAPKPDAVCRHQHCLGHAIEIYFTDPDFKGFIQISCCQSCKVEFHINCWKKLKAASFADKNDKDFLQDLCFTPDCTGRICHIVIFGSTGLIKCKFESSIPKSKTPGRSRVKQKCTSLKKLKSKEDRKLKRKQQRAAASLSKDEMNSVSSEEGKDHSETQKALPKDYTIYGDRVLHQIYESRELFNDEIHNISTMVVKLRPWMELDEANGRESILKNRTAPKVLRELVDLLLERNNRVWARLFIQYLSDCLNIKPKLHDWAQQLDKAGLKAAEKFIDRYGDRLEELDLSSLLTFSPLQDVLIEKFGTVPELFDNTGLTVMDYIKQAPPQEVRLFIWTLEEHRERYPTGFAILDEYFEMDGICLVIKKRENEDHLSSVFKSKNKSRKKKQREPKSVIVLSGMRSGVLRDEEDEDIFSEEDSLMLLDGTDPFSVPDHLRDQVAEFEGQYDGSGRLNNYKRFLDNNPDPTKETLYDYFAQILEEHGPLQPSDPLLVGELENFPVEAQRKIEAAGGLEGFLLESLRFVMTENLMGLMTHAVSLQHTVADDAAGILDYHPQSYEREDLESRGSSHLNPTAREFMPQFEHFSLSDNNASCDVAALLANKDGLTSALSEPHNSLPGPCPTLPDPRAFGSEMPHVDYMVLPQDTNVFENLKVQEAGCPDYRLNTPLKESIYDSAALVLDINNVKLYSEQGGGGEALPGIIFNEATRPGIKTVCVQTLGYNRDTSDDVAVNTEPYTLFEKNKGDMTHKEKNCVKFEKHISERKDTHESLQKKRQEDVSELEAEVEQIQQIIEITHTEHGLLQQKLEEEIRKDQQEKRDNQETVKALKGEIKELEDLRESYSKQIQEKNVEYQTELNHFLEKSNQSAAEKMSLEDEIKRCKDMCAKATSRSLAAQLSVLQNRREHGLRGLRKCVSNGNTILQNLTEVSTRYSSGALLTTIEAWKSCVQEAEQKIAGTEAQYEEQIEQVTKGTKLCVLPLLLVPSAPAPPPIPAFLLPPSNHQPVPQQFPVRHVVPHAPYGAQQHPVRSQTHPAVNTPLAQPAERATHTPPAPSAPATHTEAPQRPAAPAAPAAQTPRAPTPVQQPHGVFDRIIDRLSSMFPHYNRPVLSKFIQEVRTANAGTLNMLTYEEVINRVAQLILDHQENSREQISSVSGDLVSEGESTVRSPTPPTDTCRATPTPPPAHVWKTVSSQHRYNSKALNMEDPCIICHEDMAPEDLCVLECRHSFHRECIKSWLKEQSTCPTCREHALLPEDFPMLPGRHRRGHAPATSFS
ncbi:E3 ubiquitin-protein ligase TTC3 isoform X1 [Pygocentrus nattereri]|uniref:E3 ubiquitin-protein ligase TTC3 isoform X1 n=1 Tax=Pygocentrus nattereri TaxID=42514 RepID=UPI001890F309|nr:E3 ubiquitin-protein ligase TTC3 isoform X1 [Pygocentrus nattereri]